MTKPTVQQLGAVGLMLDGDPTMLPDQAFTDVLNVRFNGREIESYQGNYHEPYYTTPAGEGEWGVWAQQVISVIFDGFSNGARLVFMLTKTSSGDAVVWSVVSQNMNTPDLKGYYPDAMTNWPIDNQWATYKGQINNCVFFGMSEQAPLGKAYDWTGFDSLPGWGEQTGGDQVVVTRRWSCKKVIPFDNRLLMLNTVEESAGGVDVPLPNRVRWSGFAQENAFPINWDDTAANRTPEDYAAAVIDGYAGWQDIATQSQIIDACENGGTLYVYTERETFSMTPSGNDQSPFITKTVYSDLGCLDLGCVVNCHGYNYVFTGSDVVRHDAVSWKSIADGYVRDFISDAANNSGMGKVRMVGYPELSEIWVMIPGDQQEAGDYAKSIALTYNYVKNTWSKKTLPYILDVEFVPIAPDSSTYPVMWDDDNTMWDDATEVWDSTTAKISQGVLVGSCAAGGIYVLNIGSSESRWVYSNGAYAMKVQPLQAYVERRGLDFNTGYRSMITETYLNGRGTNDVTLYVGRADNPDAGYTWDNQTMNLTGQRRATWRAEGESHGYRLEIAGQGSIPVGITFKTVSTGQ
ncbi:hypothetical protein [Citrobacter sp. Marseille-Q6884]|uniref:hypothetical protein n=1 Tax=Citrobacter sp. Marseille-Q6884 TaxID=2956786 RepID=UPI0021B2CF50|nr:hypothetical protein [Citrobacter sp. Marseille-Q6884]